MASQHGLQNVGFGNDAVAQVGRQAGHVAVPLVGPVMVARRGVGAPGMGHEGLQQAQRFGPGGGDGAFDVIPRS
jgi:hypothetical protein